MPRSPTNAIIQAGNAYSRQMLTRGAARAASKLNPVIAAGSLAYDVGSYIARKNKPRKSHPKKSSTKEAQVQDSSAGGQGVTLDYKVVGKRPKKLPLDVKIQKAAARNAREQFDHGQLDTVAGEQKVFTIHYTMDNTDFQAIMGTYYANSYKKLFLEYYTTYLEIVNVANIPLELFVFQHTPKKAGTQPVHERFKEGLDRKYNGSSDIEKQPYHFLRESGTTQSFFKQNFGKKLRKILLKYLGQDLNLGALLAFQIYWDIMNLVDFLWLNLKYPRVTKSLFHHIKNCFI